MAAIAESSGELDTDIVGMVDSTESATETIHRRVGEVYAYTAGAIGIAAVSAQAFASAGMVEAMAFSSPLTSVGFLAVAVALMAAAILTPKEHSILKHSAYGLFAVTQGLVLSPLAFLSPANFAIATGAATALTGGLGVLAMNLKQSFERYERILMVGLGAIALASLGALVLPATSALVAHNISYLVGLPLFASFVIYDTHVAVREAGNLRFDPIKHAAGIYLDAVNLLVRIWEILVRRKDS